MFSAVTITDANDVQVTLFDGQHRLGECHGLHGLPPIRRIVRPNPGGHGEINETRHYGSRQPVWNGMLIGDDETELWGLYDEILGALWTSVEDARVLRWTRGDGISLQSTVKLGDAFDPILRAADVGKFLAYQLIFDREDPTNYAQASRSASGGALTSGGGGWLFPALMPVVFTPTGSSSVAVLNNGTAPTPASLTIVGQVSNPIIQQVETGRLIVIGGEVGAGSTLVIDGATKTAMLDGTTDRTSLVDFAATDWRAALIPPGGCTYKLLATSWTATAKLDPVVSHDAYA